MRNPCQVHELQVYRNDKVTVEQLSAMNPSRLVLSPGPGHPSSDAGVCEAALKAFAGVRLLVEKDLQRFHPAFRAENSHSGRVHGHASDVRSIWWHCGVCWRDQAREE